MPRSLVVAISALLCSAALTAPARSTPARSTLQDLPAVPTREPATRESIREPGDPIAAVRRAISSRDPVAQQRLMAGLRTLGDPLLVPLFSQVAEFGVGGARAQAILALAELNRAQGLDLLLVRRLSPADQAAVLSEALRAGLLTDDSLADISRWPDLEPLMLVSASARLAALGKPVDVERLSTIANGIDKPGPTRPAAVLAAATLAHIATDDESRAERLKAVVSALVPTAASARPGAVPPLDFPDTRGVLLALRQLRLFHLGPAVEAILARADLDNLTRAECIATLIELEPGSNRTLTAWLAAFSREGADRGDHLRLGVLALRLAAGMTASGPVGPALSPERPLRPERPVRPERNALVMAERLGSRRDELLSAIGASIGALASAQNARPADVLSPAATSAIIALIRLRHGSSALWAADLASALAALPPEVTAAPPVPDAPVALPTPSPSGTPDAPDRSLLAIRAALIEAAATASLASPDPQLDEAAVRAAEGLLRTDCDTALDLMRQAIDASDEKTTRILLTAGLRLSASQLARHRDEIALVTSSATPPEPLPATAAPPSRTAAMATLLHYRALSAIASPPAPTPTFPAGTPALPAASPAPESLPIIDEAAQRILARLAEPDSPLSEPARIQAAWMTIRARQQERLALTQILAEVAPQSVPDGR